jgi:TPR repeat protein
MNFFKSLFKLDPEVDFQMALKEETFNGNYKKAAWLYQKAANQGHSKAQFYCGYMYLKGRGVNKDDKKAFEFLCQAADNNYYKAQYLLAQMYLNGEGVSKNTEEGNKLLNKFKEHGKDASELSFLDL